MLNSHIATADVSLALKNFLSTAIFDTPKCFPASPKSLMLNLWGQRHVCWSAATLAGPRSHHRTYSADSSPSALPGHSLLVFQSLDWLHVQPLDIKLGFGTESSISHLYRSLKASGPRVVLRFCGPACLSRNGLSLSSTSGPNLNPGIDWMFVSPQIHIPKLSLQCDGIWVEL